MELCPDFKIGKKYHPDFEEVLQLPSKNSSQDPPCDEELSARLIFQGPLSDPHREFYSHTGGRRHNLPHFAIVIFTELSIVL